jgi:NAD(P)-dependent dehydrogenase (short-subunit alcohol dehydrogenase family)
MTGHREFSGRTAVITGAADGLGAACARRAATLGMRVVLADIDPDRLRRTADTLAADGADVLAVVTDVGDPDSVEQLAQRAYAHFPSIDVVINNAGVEAAGQVWEWTPEAFDRLMRVNMYGVFHGIRAFVPRMIAAGRGHIANVASVGAFRATPFNSPYQASKHAVLVLTEALAQELAQRGHPVDVSLIVPSALQTDIFASVEVFDSPGSDEAAAVADQYHTYLRTQGLEPETAARRIFDGLAARDFWVLTQPEEVRGYAADRGRVLIELS